MRTSPHTALGGGVAAMVLGILFQFRLLPFLEADTILSGGKQVPTAEFASHLAGIFFLFGTLAILFAVIWLVRKSRRARGPR